MNTLTDLNVRINKDVKKSVKNIFVIIENVNN